jgi:hypothetical protein
MSSASEWYYLSLVNYYLGRRSRKKAKKRRRAGASDEDPPDDDFGPDPDESLFGDIIPYTIVGQRHFDESFCCKFGAGKAVGRVVDVRGCTI